jgi:hypothetical protein
VMLAQICISRKSAARSRSNADFFKQWLKPKGKLNY